MSRESEWFRLTRIRLGYNETEMGEIMGLTRVTINNIETGRITKYSTLRYYELTLEDLKRKIPNYKEITIWKLRLSFLLA